MAWRFYDHSRRSRSVVGSKHAGRRRPLNGISPLDLQGTRCGDCARNARNSASSARMRPRNPSASDRALGSRSKLSRRRYAVRTVTTHSPLKVHCASRGSFGIRTPYSTSSRNSASVRPDNCASSASETSQRASSHTVSLRSALMFHPLLEMAARIERRAIRQLPEQRPLLVAHDAGHDDLHDREKIARAFVGLGQAAIRQPQLLPGLRPRRHLELHRSAQRRDLQDGAEHGLPRCEGQIEIKVIAARAIQRMRAQRDIQVKVAAGPAVDPLAAFAPQAQPLSVRGAPGNARRERVRHPTQQSAFVELGHAEIEIYLGAPVGVLQGDLRGDFVVLPRDGHGAAPAAGATPAAGELLEQVRQIDVLERVPKVAELPPPVRRRPEVLPGRVPAQLIVGGALFRILERRVGLGDLLEFRLALRVLGNVRVILVRELAIGLLDRGLVGAALHAEGGVVILVFHFDAPPGTRSFPASRAWIAAWRASRRSARVTTGTSTILPSIANDARPAAAALAFPSITRFAWATSSAEGEYSSFTIVTCPGWMQLAPRKPYWRDLRTMRRNASQSPNAATLAM